MKFLPLERRDPLKKESDFQNAIGKNVLIKTYEALDGLKEFEGELVSYDVEHGATVNMSGQVIQIPIAKIASARLCISF